MTKNLKIILQITISLKNIVFFDSKLGISYINLEYSCLILRFSYPNFLFSWEFSLKS